MGRVDTGLSFLTLQDYGHAWSDWPESRQVPHCHSFKEMFVVHLWIHFLDRSSNSFSNPSHRLAQKVVSKTDDHMPHDWKIVLRPWSSSTIPRTSSRFCASRHIALKQIHSNSLGHLGQPRPTQLKCACCSRKTKYRYCKRNVGIHGRCCISVPHKVNYSLTTPFDWVPNLWHQRHAHYLQFWCP